MSTNDAYLAIFLGSKTSPKMMAWNSLPETERRAKEREGIAAWKAWVEKHQGAIVAMGGPLGKTKKITQRGIEDVSNDMGAFTVVRAESNEAAAKLFENHPHFAREQRQAGDRSANSDPTTSITACRAGNGTIDGARKRYERSRDTCGTGSALGRVRCQRF